MDLTTPPWLGSLDPAVKLDVNVTHNKTDLEKCIDSMYNLPAVIHGSLFAAVRLTIIYPNTSHSDSLVTRQHIDFDYI